MQKLPVSINGVIEPFNPQKRAKALARLAAIRASVCPPPVENSEPRSVTVPGEDGQGVGILGDQGLESLMSSTLTKTHLNPSGVSGFVDLAQLSESIFSLLSPPKTSMPARISPIAATRQIPQNVTALIVITGSPSVSSS